jgi:hypothetical protein
MSLCAWAAGDSGLIPDPHLSAMWDTSVGPILPTSLALRTVT